MFLNLLASGGDQKVSPIFFIVIGVVAVLFIVMNIFSNKQRKKQYAEEQAKRDSLCPDTKVITIGGIVGTVVSVNEEENTFVMVSEGNALKFDKRAIYQMTLPEGAEIKSLEPAPVEEAPAELTPVEEKAEEKVEEKAE